MHSYVKFGSGEKRFIRVYCGPMYGSLKVDVFVGHYGRSLGCPLVGGKKIQQQGYFLLVGTQRNLTSFRNSIPYILVGFGLFIYAKHSFGLGQGWTQLAQVMEFLCATVNQSWKKRATIGHKKKLGQIHRISEQASDKACRFIKENRTIKC